MGRLWVRIIQDHKIAQSVTAPCAPGEDLGTFEFGSTVVLLVGGSRAQDWEPLRTEGPVKVGQRLGAYR